MRRNRIRLFGTGEDAQEAMAQALGAIGSYRAAGTIKGWEASDVRSGVPDDMMDTLGRLFDDPYPGDDALTGQQMDQAAVVAAIREQTAVLSRQADLLQSLLHAVGRLDQSVSGGMIGLGEALALDLAKLVGTLSRTDTAPDAPHAPDDSASASGPRNNRPGANQ